METLIITKNVNYIYRNIEYSPLPLLSCEVTVKYNGVILENIMTIHNTLTTSFFSEVTLPDTLYNRPETSTENSLEITFIYNKDTSNEVVAIKNASIIFVDASQ